MSIEGDLWRKLRGFNAKHKIDASLGPEHQGYILIGEGGVGVTVSIDKSDWGRRASIVVTEPDGAFRTVYEKAEKRAA